MSTHCRKCGKEKEASRPRSHLCRTCDKQAKGTMPVTKLDLGSPMVSMDYEATELKIMAHQAKAMSGPLKITLPDTWKTTKDMMKKHSSGCGCPQCSEDMLVRWIKQKSSHLVEYHMRFNAGREDFDPNLVHAMIVQMCVETTAKIKEGMEAEMAFRKQHETRLQEKLLTQRKQISDLERELQARRAAATVTVPSTEGRVFREE